MEDKDRLSAALGRLPQEERPAWIKEANRLARIVEHYAGLRPKRRRHAITGRYEFVSDAFALCQQAACRDPVILKREPHRARPPSPHTLDDWRRAFRRDGLLTFLRCLSSQSTAKSDLRRAKISPAALSWVNSHWRSFDSPRQLYEALGKQAARHGWTIPGEQWLYRKWRVMPAIIQTQHRDGWQAYEARYAPYAPRDFTDLEALQVLCGDHSERDVTVLLKDGSLVRPWLTMWFDLRTGLIWGWHLDLTPSSVTAGLAYADGVENFGAQPPARPEEDFFSYVYTDRGRDYRSHYWDGRVLAVHERAMSLEGGLEFVITERRVGILEELRVKHLTARGYNAKEKPVERIHRDLSTWEQNTFAEYCGRDAKSRPERWHKLYEQHLQSGVVSYISAAAADEESAAGVVGDEGVVGIPSFLRYRRAVFRVIVQMRGEALRVDGEFLQRECEKGGELPHLILCHAHTVVSQFAQAIVCNRFHTVEKRLTRFLLMVHDRAHRDTLHLTHEFLANMLGTSRTDVTEAAGALRDAGLISYRRGAMTILDKAGLRAATCVCYHILLEQYEHFIAP